MDIGLDIVAVLVDLVTDSIDGSVGTSAQLGIGVLGNLLVGLLGSSRAEALDGLSNVVDGVLRTCLVLLPPIS